MYSICSRFPVSNLDTFSIKVFVNSPISNFAILIHLPEQLRSHTAVILAGRASR